MRRVSVRRRTASRTLEGHLAHKEKKISKAGSWYGRVVVGVISGWVIFMTGEGTGTRI